MIPSAAFIATALVLALFFAPLLLSHARNNRRYDFADRGGAAGSVHLLHDNAGTQ